MTVGQGLKMLAKHKILSAPLIMSPGLEDLEGEGAADPQGPTLIGWVDIADILRGLLHQLHQKHPRLPANMLLLMTELGHEGKAFTGRTLVSLTGGDDKSLVYEGEAGAPLLHTIRAFYLNNSGSGRAVHRLALFDAHGQVGAVVSQLDIIRYMAHNLDALGAAANMSIEELGLVRRGTVVAHAGSDSLPTSPTQSSAGNAPAAPAHNGVVCVEPHMPTLLALERINALGVSAAAVVAPPGNGAKGGELVANLSVSDLRCIQTDHLSVLALPVAEFLALLHNTSYLGYSQRSSEQAEHPFFASGPRSASPPLTDPAAAAADDNVRLITCKAGAALKDVLKLLSDNGVHRVYVIDPEAKPQVIAVITPTDILRWVAKA